jgi:hypothetical protein
VLNESPFYQYPDLFFEDLAGYIVGDAAYRLTNRVIKPFNEPELSPVDSDDEEASHNRAEYNEKLSAARVEVEHTFGMLKSRFPMLSNLACIIGYIDTNETVFPPH